MSIILDPKSIYSEIKKELSIKKCYEQVKPKLFHILLGGALDSATTVIALSVFSISELNPLVNQLLPDHVYLIPIVLVELAFLRYVIVSSIFKKSKYLNFAVLFTLYFLPIWNVGNILLSQV